MPPHDGLHGARGKGDKMDAPHAQTRSIAGAQGGREGVRHEFGNGGRPGGEIIGKPLEVAKEAVDALGEPEALPAWLLVAEGFLENGEEANGAWNGQCH